MVLSAHRAGQLPAVWNRRIGPPLVFERLWKETGCRAVIESLSRGRRFGFRLERALFVTVLHRLFDPGSDRAAEGWRKAYRMEGIQELELDQLYRAMAWLGEELPEREQEVRTAFAPRCVKDLVEEELFGYRRHLFSSLDLVFFDTTSLSFCGQGGETLGRHGKSKERRPELRQMILRVVLDERGLPLCCEIWPGNTADVKTLIPVVDRLRQRFSIGRVCVVADRGMISREVIEQLESEQRQWDYILGVRLRQVEVGREVLARAGRYRVVRPARLQGKDPAPLKVKEAVVHGKTYILCLNEEQAFSDALTRQAILESLKKRLGQGDKSLVGNRGFRKYLKTAGGRFEIDRRKVAQEARYDGKWVLRTSLQLPADEVALKYKPLWRVEEIVRTLKSVLKTRPIYHQTDEAIRGHVFCSFLALVLRKELEDRLEAAGHRLEWAEIRQDLDLLEEVLLEQEGKRFLLRTEARAVAGKVFQAVGVALPPTVRRLEAEESG